MDFAPNLNFYTLLQESLSHKYNITIKGKPSFENGEIRLQGEVRTPLGLIQLADFQIRATVEDNKLVFDIDKAKVLQIIGKNGVARFVNQMLNKTDIDVFRRSNDRLEIELADIVKDLSLTQGINFTDLKLVDHHFEVGFYYSSLDQEMAKAAKDKNTQEIQKLLGQQDLTRFSGESLATAFNSLLKLNDQNDALHLMQNTAAAYRRTESQSERYELGRALDWMAHSSPARKADLEDNLALSFAQPELQSRAGKTRLQALPQNFLQQLANNLDGKDLGFWDPHWVSKEERNAAQNLRALAQKATPAAAKPQSESK